MINRFEAWLDRNEETGNYWVTLWDSHTGNLEFSPECPLHGWTPERIRATVHALMQRML